MTGESCSPAPYDHANSKQPSRLQFFTSTRIPKHHAYSACLTLQQTTLSVCPQVNLQVVAIDDLFVMAPLSKYDLYFMGRSVYSSVKVAASQTNEDAKEEECQTEDVSGVTANLADDHTVCRNTLWHSHFTMFNAS